MDSNLPLSSTETISTKRTISRRLPLHTCGVSFLAIAHKICTKTQDFNGPIGSLTTRITKLALPFIYAMQIQWLAVLSFADGYILTIENIVETIFPPSAYVFNRLDEFVHIVETLPEKFDYAMNKFPPIVHQVPFLKWGLVQIIWWLNILVSVLTHCGSESTREKEKEIIVDISCNEQENESRSGEHANSENLEKLSENPEAENKTYQECASVTKYSYKDVLAKGTKENLDKKEGSVQEEMKKPKVNQEENENGSDEFVTKDDPILELFESGWHMKSGKGGTIGSPMARSISYA